MPVRQHKRTTRAVAEHRHDDFAIALTRLAGARAEPELASLLHVVAASEFRAAAAIMVTRDPTAVPVHRVAQLSGSAAPAVLPTADQGIEARLDEGAPFATDAPASELPGVPLPRSRRAALIPCGGEGSMHGICLCWAERPRVLSAGTRDRLSLLAAVTGLALDRLLGARRARLQRAGTDNRIRNVLAVIRSVGTRSAERASSMDDFLMHFEGRVDAIGRSQIAACRPDGISFEHLLRDELLAQTIQDGANVSLDGIDVTLTPEQAEALGLSIHELAVNALKFGALSGPGGALAVRWWVESAAGVLALNVDWRESNAPQPPRPGRIGFGRTYLEQALPFQLKAEVVLNFTPGGLRCQISVPLDQTGPAHDAPRPPRRTSRPRQPVLLRLSRD